MLSVVSVVELAPHVGSEVGTSAWVEVTEAMILAFADVTRERHWIHTDMKRVRAETAYRGLVAHGFLTLSLLTSLAGECFEFRGRARILNYGLNRLRFIEVVTAGDRVRLRLKLNAVAATERGARLDWHCVVEIEDKFRPALVTDFIWAVEQT